MSEDRIQTLIAEYARKYPPLLTAEQAAEIAGLGVATIHNMSCAGRFDGFKARSGKLRIDRDAFIRLIATHRPPAKGGNNPRRARRTPPAATRIEQLP